MLIPLNAGLLGKLLEDFRDRLSVTGWDPIRTQFRQRLADEAPVRTLRVGEHEMWLAHRTVAKEE